MNVLPRVRWPERVQHFLLELREPSSDDLRRAVSSIRAEEKKAREETEHRWVESGYGWRLTR